MTISRRLGPSALLLALTALALGGCTAPAGDDATEDQNQAIGERWWSPVAIGTYDADDASVAITNTLQGQRLVYSAPAYVLAGSVSRDGNGVTTRDDENGGVLRARQDGTNLVVSVDAPGSASDAQDLTFVRREPNAVRGRYAPAGRPTVLLEVDGSTDTTLVLRITQHGRTVEMRGRRGSSETPRYELGGDYDGCSVTVARARGAFTLEVPPQVDPACKLPRGVYTR